MKIKKILKSKTDDELLNAMSNYNKHNLLYTSISLNFIPGIEKALLMGADPKNLSDFSMKLSLEVQNIQLVKLFLELGCRPLTSLSYLRNIINQVDDKFYTEAEALLIKYNTKEAITKYNNKNTNENFTNILEPKSELEIINDLVKKYDKSYTGINKLKYFVGFNMYKPGEYNNYGKYNVKEKWIEYVGNDIKKAYKYYLQSIMEYKDHMVKGENEGIELFCINLSEDLERIKSYGTSMRKIILMHLIENEKIIIPNEKT